MSMFPYEFKHLIGAVVEWNGDWWEIIARMEHRSEVDGKIYPWYKLARPYEAKVQYLWVWACPIDNELSDSSSNEDNCCPEPPPDCPQPPCAP
jgi:hypothetical protein